jgi:hypothetical protein
MKHHELTHAEWLKIRQQIRVEFGDSMILLRDKMRRELGFTARHHREWNPNGVFPVMDDYICIDFYTEQARTWFLLKFV